MKCGSRVARWYKKSQFGYIYESLVKEIVGIFYGH
jgi:hypothetical protein